MDQNGRSSPDWVGAECLIADDGMPNNAGAGYSRPLIARFHGSEGTAAGWALSISTLQVVYRRWGALVLHGRDEMPCRFTLACPAAANAWTEPGPHVSYCCMFGGILTQTAAKIR